SGSGRHLRVAVVARETLEEAEAFARKYRFNPVSFVACPEMGRFIGEPFFGPTSVADTLIPKGAKLKRDPIPVQVVGRAERPATEAAPVFGAKAPFASHASGNTQRGAPPAELDTTALAQPRPEAPADTPEAAREAAASTPDAGPAGRA